jgi:threonine aldolase
MEKLVVIDLRSDTVTRPTPAMREAIAAADVGDDDYHDDPTVNRLEDRSAALLGKEAGLFVPSGIMSNLIAALTHCPDGRRVVAMTNSHIAWSLTGDARVGRLVQLTLVKSDGRGLPVMAELLAAFDDPDADPPGLLCLENSHNQVGGTALTAAELAVPIAVARERGLPVHLDGARLFNASVALGVPASELVADCDSATFCVSKGLGAPVGSVLCGTAGFIEQAREYRKWLGGTMRQAGLLAAAGLHAIDHGIDRLAEDNDNARWLGERLAAIPGMRVHPETIETNIVFVDHEEIPATVLFERLLDRGVQTNELGGQIRLVTHLDVDRAQLEEAVRIFADIVQPVEQR